jgi:type IV secretion system protein VirD4
MTVFSLPEPAWLFGAAAAMSIAAVAAYDLNPLRQRHETGTAYGSAAWANSREQRRAGLYRGKGLILGRDNRHRLLRLATDRHLLTMAPTRSGRRRDGVTDHGLSVICVQKVPLTKVSKIREIAFRAEVILLI